MKQDALFSPTQDRAPWRQGIFHKRRQAALDKRRQAALDKRRQAALDIDEVQKKDGQPGASRAATFN